MGTREAEWSGRTPAVVPLPPIDTSSARVGREGHTSISSSRSISSDPSPRLRYNLDVGPQLIYPATNDVTGSQATETNKLGLPPISQDPCYRSVPEKAESARSDIASDRSGWLPSSPTERLKSQPSSPSSALFCRKPNPIASLSSNNGQQVDNACDRKPEITLSPAAPKSPYSKKWLSKYTNGAGGLLASAQGKGRLVTDIAAEILDRESDPASNLAFARDFQLLLQKPDSIDRDGLVMPSDATIDSWISIREALKLQLGIVCKELVDRLKVAQPDLRGHRQLIGCLREFHSLVERLRIASIEVVLAIRQWEEETSRFGVEETAHFTPRERDEPDDDDGQEIADEKGRKEEDAPEATLERERTKAETEAGASTDELSKESAMGLREGMQNSVSLLSYLWQGKPYAASMTSDLDFLEHQLRGLRALMDAYNSNHKLNPPIELPFHWKSLLRNPFLIPLTLDDIAAFEILPLGETELDVLHINISWSQLVELMRYLIEQRRKYEQEVTASLTQKQREIGDVSRVQDSLLTSMGRTLQLPVGASELRALSLVHFPCRGAILVTAAVKLILRADRPENETDVDVDLGMDITQLNWKLLRKCFKHPESLLERAARFVSSGCSLSTAKLMKLAVLIAHPQFTPNRVRADSPTFADLCLWVLRILDHACGSVGGYPGIGLLIEKELRLLKETESRERIAGSKGRPLHTQTEGSKMSQIRHEADFVEAVREKYTKMKKLADLSLSSLTKTTPKLTKNFRILQMAERRQRKKRLLLLQTACRLHIEDRQERVGHRAFVSSLSLRYRHCYVPAPGLLLRLFDTRARREESLFLPSVMCNRVIGVSLVQLLRASPDEYPSFLTKILKSLTVTRGTSRSPAGISLALMADSTVYKDNVRAHRSASSPAHREVFTPFLLGREISSENKVLSVAFEAKADCNGGFSLSLVVSEPTGDGGILRENSDRNRLLLTSETLHLLVLDCPSLLQPPTEDENDDLKIAAEISQWLSGRLYNIPSPAGGPSRFIGVQNVVNLPGREKWVQKVRTHLKEEDVSLLTVVYEERLHFILRFQGISNMTSNGSWPSLSFREIGALSATRVPKNEEEEVVEKYPFAAIKKLVDYESPVLMDKVTSHRYLFERLRTVKGESPNNGDASSESVALDIDRRLYNSYRQMRGQPWILRVELLRDLADVENLSFPTLRVSARLKPPRSAELENGEETLQTPEPPLLVKIVSADDCRTLLSQDGVTQEAADNILYSFNLRPLAAYISRKMKVVLDDNMRRPEEKRDNEMEPRRESGVQQWPSYCLETHLYRERFTLHLFFNQVQEGAAIGSVAITDTTTLKQLRDIIAREIDSDMLPEEFKFAHQGVVCSRKQEPTKLARAFLPSLCLFNPKLQAAGGDLFLGGFQTVLHAKEEEIPEITIISIYETYRGGWKEGDKLKAMVNVQDSVGQLKKLLEEQLSMPVSSQRLVHRGVELQDERPLQHYGLKMGSVVRMRPPLPPQKKVRVLLDGRLQPCATTASSFIPSHNLTVARPPVYPQILSVGDEVVLEGSERVVRKVLAITEASVLLSPHPAKDGKNDSSPQESRGGQPDSGAADGEELKERKLFKLIWEAEDKRPKWIRDFCDGRVPFHFEYRGSKECLQFFGISTRKEELELAVHQGDGLLHMRREDFVSKVDLKCILDVVFTTVVRWPPPSDAIEGGKFAKLAREYNLLGCGADLGTGYRGLTKSDMDLIFNKVRPPGERRLDREAFARSLPFVAKLVYPSMGQELAVQTLVFEKFAAHSKTLAWVWNLAKDLAMTAEGRRRSAAIRLQAFMRMHFASTNGIMNSQGQRLGGLKRQRDAVTLVQAIMRGRLGRLRKKRKEQEEGKREREELLRSQATLIQAMARCYIYKSRFRRYLTLRKGPEEKERDIARTRRIQEIAVRKRNIVLYSCRRLNNDMVMITVRKIPGLLLQVYVPKNSETFDISVSENQAISIFLGSLPTKMSMKEFEERRDELMYCPAMVAACLARLIIKYNGNRTLILFSRKRQVETGRFVLRKVVTVENAQLIVSVYRESMTLVFAAHDPRSCEILRTSVLILSIADWYQRYHQGLTTKLLRLHNGAAITTSTVTEAFEGVITPPKTAVQKAVIFWLLRNLKIQDSRPSTSKTKGDTRKGAVAGGAVDKKAITFTFEILHQSLKVKTILIQSVWRSYTTRLAVRKQYLPLLQKVYDSQSKMFYYTNIMTGYTTWSKPKLLGSEDVPAPPDRWEMRQDDQGRVYYFHPLTGRFSWISEEDAASRIQTRFRSYLSKPPMRMTLSELANALMIFRDVEGNFLEDPSRIPSVVNYGLYLLTWEKRYDAAEDLLKQAMTLSPHNPVVLYAYSVLLLASGLDNRESVWGRVRIMTEEAQKSDGKKESFQMAEKLFFRTSVILNPGNATSLLLYALVQQVVYRDYDSCDRYYRRALACDPANEAISLNLSDFLVNRLPGGLYEGGGPPADTRRRGQPIEGTENAEWVQMQDPTAMEERLSRFWYNWATQECQWHEPDWEAEWVKRKQRGKVKKYFGPWAEMEDPVAQQIFYFNRQTKRCQWEYPA